MENKNFEMLQHYTLEACNMETFPEDMFTENGNKWLDLICAWDMLLEGGSEEIFEEASHIIMWGIHREYRRSLYDKIIDLVVEEMLRDGDAFNTWDSCVFFENAIGYRSSAMDPCSNHNYRYSIEHH